MAIDPDRTCDKVNVRIGGKLRWIAVGFGIGRELEVFNCLPCGLGAGVQKRFDLVSLAATLRNEVWVMCGAASVSQGAICQIRSTSLT